MANEAKEKIYDVTVFLKSRKSMKNRIDMVNQIRDELNTERSKVTRVIFDSSAGMDIDRPEIDLLADVIEKRETDLIVIRRRRDLTNNPVDLIELLEKCEKNNIFIYVFEEDKFMRLDEIPVDCPLLASSDKKEE